MSELHPWRLCGLATPFGGPPLCPTGAGGTLVFSPSSQSSCQRRQLSSEPGALSSFSRAARDLLPLFVAAVVTGALFFCGTRDSSPICRPPSVPLLHVLNPSSVFTPPLCPGWWRGAGNGEGMFVRPYCSWADSGSPISHPFRRRVKYSNTGVVIFLIV